MDGALALGVEIEAAYAAQQAAHEKLEVERVRLEAFATSPLGALAGCSGVCWLPGIAQLSACPSCAGCVLRHDLLRARLAFAIKTSALTTLCRRQQTLRRRRGAP